LKLYHRTLPPLGTRERRRHQLVGALLAMFAAFVFYLLL
jgi:hypothetical protein